MSAPAIPAAGRDVEKLLEEFQRSGLRELHVRADGFELYLSSEADAEGIVAGQAVPPAAAPAQPAPAPATPADATVPAAPPTVSAQVPEGAATVLAPYLGTFYRAPKPGSPNYVEIGQRVSADDELCLVEVMKLFTAVRAGVAGTVAAVLADDGQLVEAGQPLFAIRAD